MPERSPHKVTLVGRSSSYMLVAAYLAEFHARCKHCLSGRRKPGVFGPGIVGTRGSMLIRHGHACHEYSSTFQLVLEPEQGLTAPTKVALHGVWENDSRRFTTVPVVVNYPLIEMGLISIMVFSNVFAFEDKTRGGGQQLSLIHI